MKSYINLALLFLLSGAFFQLSASEIINEIRLEGLSRTKPDYLRQFINSTEGDIYDAKIAERDAQELRNLGLFSEANLSIKSTGTGTYITFSCSELISLLPIINLGGLSDNFWYQLGALDNNWLGRGNRLGGFYRYYDRHSFAAFMTIPRIIGSRWGFTADISHISTIEPAFFQNGTASYNVDNNAYLAGLRFNLGNLNWLELVVGENSPGPDQQSFEKLLIKLGLMQQSIDYYYHYLDGFANDVFVETVRTKGEDGKFWKVLSISRYFQRINERGNWATRLRLGLSTNRISPFVPFVLDSYLTARGSGNRSSRGTAEFTINTEYRHSIFENKSAAIQAVAFIDASAWRPAGGELSKMFNKENNVTLTGLGTRLYLRKLNNLIIRADYGVSLTTDGQHGLVFGIGQYF